MPPDIRSFFGSKDAQSSNLSTATPVKRQVGPYYFFFPQVIRLLTNKPDICRIHQPKDRDVRLPFVQYRTISFLTEI